MVMTSEIMSSHYLRYFFEHHRLARGQARGDTSSQSKKVVAVTSKTFGNENVN